MTSSDTKSLAPGVGARIEAGLGRDVGRPKANIRVEQLEKRHPTVAPVACLEGEPITLEVRRTAGERAEAQQQLGGARGLDPDRCVHGRPRQRERQIGLERVRGLRAGMDRPRAIEQLRPRSAALVQRETVPFRERFEEGSSFSAIGRVAGMAARRSRKCAEGSPPVKGGRRSDSKKPWRQRELTRCCAFSGVASGTLPSRSTSAVMESGTRASSRVWRTAPVARTETAWAAPPVMSTRPPRKTATELATSRTSARTAGSCSRPVIRSISHSMSGRVRVRAGPDPIVRSVTSPQSTRPTPANRPVRCRPAAHADEVAQKLGARARRIAGTTSTLQRGVEIAAGDENRCPDDRIVRHERRLIRRAVRDHAV